jgi:hypothetical protein
LLPGVFLIAGDHYLCMDAALGGGGLGGTCSPIKKAIQNGISTDFVVAVPDGTKAIEYRYRWHGAWTRVPVRDGYARTPRRLGYQVRLVG